MTEEIIKECKNCDALGIDSEIGVYYCCLSHRQDDLPKEFTCDDFTPNKQLLCLEQENKELKSQRDEARIAYNGLILDIVSDIPFKGEIGGEREISIKDHLHQMQKALASLEEIREINKLFFERKYGYPEDLIKIDNIINEVLK